MRVEFNSSLREIQGQFSSSTVKLLMLTVTTFFFKEVTILVTLCSYFSRYQT